jgi:predicted DCC family thiol-disulfide oxidoreductase YuxK
MAHNDFSDFAREPLLGAYLTELRRGLVRSVLRYCVDCASGASPSRRERIEREARDTLLGRVVDFPFPEICAAVGHPDLGEAFRAPLYAETPVLFVTGEWDARTPAENVASLAPGLSRHRHLVVDGVGHTDLLFPSSVQRAVVRYLGEGEIESERVRSDEPFAFERAKAVLLYDGECGFCLRQVRSLRERVGDAVAFEPLQASGERAAQVGREDLMRTIHLVAPDGQVVTGAEAIFRALAAGGRPVLFTLYRRLPGFALATELGYRLVARNRTRLARWFPSI